MHDVFRLRHEFYVTKLRLQRIPAIAVQYCDPICINRNQMFLLLFHSNLLRLLVQQHAGDLHCLVRSLFCDVIPAVHLNSPEACDG